jgi:hypothetical protein
MRIYYASDGTAVDDWGVESMYDVVRRFQHHDIEVRFSTSPIFMRIRIGILEKEIDPNLVKIYFNGVQVPVNEYGSVIPYPKGFCDLDLHLAEHLLRGAMKMRREQRAKEDNQ